LVDRQGEKKEIQAMAISGVAGIDKPALGISLGEVGVLKLPFFTAITEAGKITFYMLGTVIIGLYSLVQASIVGHADLSQLTGPVGIVGLVGQASAVGVAYLLGFVAMISVNLAVINLLPFPALDGGRILFVLIESIIRRPIKSVIANTVNTLGFVLLMFLMIVVTYHDIVKLL
jgi:regulator of sigma E protease